MSSNNEVSKVVSAIISFINNQYSCYCFNSDACANEVGKEEAVTAYQL